MSDAHAFITDPCAICGSGRYCWLHDANLPDLPDLIRDPFAEHDAKVIRLPATPIGREPAPPT